MEERIWFATAQGTGVASTATAVLRRIRGEFSRCEVRSANDAGLSSWVRSGGDRLVHAAVIVGEVADIDCPQPAGEPLPVEAGLSAALVEVKPASKILLDVRVSRNGTLAEADLPFSGEQSGIYC